MSENVFLFGAGASADAGIPTLKTFMDAMWQIAKIGKWNGREVKSQDREVLIEALKVREELDSYHGRVALNVWNIEDILSVLAFNALAGGKREKDRLRGMTKAIARVIEITTDFTHDGKLNQDLKVGLYQNFWRALIDWTIYHTKTLPPILTFNYDLVLERAFLHAAVGKYYRTHERRFPYEAIQFCYSNDRFQPTAFLTEDATWDQYYGNLPKERGMILKESSSGQTLSPEKLLTVELLKLHGSVNFPRTSDAEPNPLTSTQRLIRPLDDPLILPPVFNKATESVGKDIWPRAMQLLRGCKNLIICGYSLPTTDIYMQYFLKAALGPNQDLNRIFVFDPSLFDPARAHEGDALRERYACIFSKPIQDRIVYQPFVAQKFQEAPNKGTTTHLVHLLSTSPGEILFGS